MANLNSSARASITRPHRASRFGRPETLRDTDLTERDADIFFHLYLRRFMRSDQLVGLVPGSEKKIVERLGQLFYAGYLDRVRDHDHQFSKHGGSHRLVYAIANDAARALVQSGRIDPDQGHLDWVRKNREAKRPFIAHTVAVSDISVSLNRAIAMHNGFSLAEYDTLIQSLPQQTRHRETPWKWGPVSLPPHYATSYGTTTVTNVPDYASIVTFPDGMRRATFWEHDEGQMPIARSTFNTSSILKKLVGYHFGIQRQLHQKMYGWSSLRILFIASNAKRRDNTLAAIKGHRDLFSETRGTHFWVTDKASFDASPDVLKHEWRLADGTTKTLLTTTNPQKSSAHR